MIINFKITRESILLIFAFFLEIVTTHYHFLDNFGFHVMNVRFSLDTDYLEEEDKGIILI